MLSKRSQTQEQVLYVDAFYVKLESSASRLMAA